MSDAARRRELGSFLRAHRERLRPADVGLPENTVSRRRRAPGLRREEVAALAGVGVTWYSWLEQGRVNVSRQVLDSVTRVLQLDDTACEHALTLGGFSWTKPTSSSRGRIVEDLQPMLDSWRTSPAILLDQHFDILAWNTAYSALWPDPADVDDDSRNLLWILVSDHRLRESVRGWEPLTKALVAHLRSQLVDHENGMRGQEILARLREQEPQLRHWWECKSVRSFTTQRITQRVDEADIGLTVSCLRPVEHPDALILLQNPSTELNQQRLARIINRRQRSEHHAM